MLSRVCVVILVLVMGGGLGCRKDSATPHVAADIKVNNWFEDITASAGLDFVHDAGATGKYLVPEQMGSGCALFDFDNDGRLDVYLIQNGGPASNSKNQLYQQQDDGRFKDVSANSGLDVAGFGMGVAVGDVNNDGLADVLFTEYGAARLFQNEGNAKFREITQAAGIDNPRWATSASFFDYDRDGWLDLVIGNYLDFDPSQKCIDSQGVQDFCGPHGFPGLVAKLYRNASRESGKMQFVDVTVPSGFARAPGPALGVLCADFNADRWPDVFLADDGKPNRLFINKQNGTFVEEAALHGLAYNAMGQTAGNMGIAIGDVNADGLFDIFVTHLTEELHALWIQGPRGAFQDRAAAMNLSRPLWRGTGFGAILADFDVDGDSDLAFVNGLVKRSRAQPSQPIPRLNSFWLPYAQRNQIFANDGGSFSEISLQNPVLCGQAIVGRGLACGDINNDGRPDLLVTGTAGPAQLLRNMTTNSGHWLVIRAVDPALGGRDAYGAEITIHTGSQRRWGLVQPGCSYLSSNDPRAHFGLGSASRIDSIHVVWPDGAEEEFPSIVPNQSIVLRKGSGKQVL